MQRRSAAKLGMAVEEYLALRARQKAEREAQPKAESRSYVRCCPECDIEFITRIANQVVCGAEECKRRRASRASSAAIMRRYYRDPEFRDKLKADVHARRASKLGLGSQRITLQYLLERDSWRCGICKKRIRSLKDASIDHIVPLSVGGEHAKENVQAAHRHCNCAKGNRGGGEQLLLVG